MRTQLLLRLIGMPDTRVTNTNSQRILRDKISTNIPPLSNGGHPLVAHDVEHVSVGHIVCRGHEVHQRIHNLRDDAHVTARVALDLLAQVLPERANQRQFGFAKTCALPGRVAVQLDVVKPNGEGGQVAAEELGVLDEVGKLVGFV